MDQQTFRKQVPIALTALGTHMRTHELPLPIDIDIRANEQRICVRVPGEVEQTAWLNTVTIEGEENRPWVGPVWVRTTWTVRLPDLGIAIELIGLRRLGTALTVERHLAAVPA